MKGILQNKMIITILSISLILILGFVGFRLYLVYFYKPLEAKITVVEVKEIRNDPDFDRDFWIEFYDLSPDQADDIINNPEDYRRIIYRCELKNNSTFATIYRDRFDPVFSKGMKTRALGSNKDFPTFNILPQEASWELIATIVKVKEGDTDESLMELAKKDKLILTVGKHSNVGANNMGSYSIELKYEGK